MMDVGCGSVSEAMARVFPFICIEHFILYLTIACGNHLPFVSRAMRAVTSKPQALSHARLVF